MTAGATILATARTDSADRLVAADEPLAGLQVRCGGEPGGTIAIPALLDLVRKARRYALKLARPIAAQDGVEGITAWVEVQPASDGGEGCEIAVHTWQSAPLASEDGAAVARRKAEIDRAVAELTARLDANLGILAVDADAADLAPLVRRMRAGLGRRWTEFVAVDGEGQDRSPMHWRLLDGAMVDIEGSPRRWRVSLFPQPAGSADPVAFELCLTADSPLDPQRLRTDEPGAANGQGIVGRDLAPVLRQPIARIIANAETIRTRLAGPLADEYSRYAADIASAGQHLLALIDDMADLEVVEADDFSTAPDHIDLGDVARRAAGILGVKARERNIALIAPQAGETLPAIAEFRRVLQILLNLVGNAVRYAPAGSQVWVRLEQDEARARVIVADQGPGLSPEQQDRVFRKFERLGRSGDGGSGLGLYISRRLARAMGGDLTVESAPGQGARFILELAADASVALAAQ